MASLLTLSLLSFAILSFMFVSSYGQRCASYTFTNNTFFRTCNDLPVLDDYLHWNYDAATARLELAYRHENASALTWVAWAINPTGSGMIGSQALVAYQQTNGAMRVYTSPITSYTTLLQEGILSFGVSDLTATYANNEMIIYATVELPGNQTTVNLVWQDGPLLGGVPAIHSVSGPNVQSMITLDLLSGESGNAGGM